ncbi:MAG: AraC family transcriptional regulator [Pseudomonadota bacterium]
MGQITSLFARKMVAAAGDAIDGQAALHSVGLRQDAPWNPKEMILDEAYYAMLEAMARQMDVTALPVKVGASMRCDEYGALGLAWKAAPDLRSSLLRVARFARLWTSVVRYELRDVEDGTLYIIHRDGPRRLGVRLSNETTLIATVSLARQVCPVPFAPLKAFVQHPAPATTAHHEDYLRCPIAFGAPYDALLCSQASLAEPNRLGDAGISAYLSGHLEVELSEMRDDTSLVAQAKDTIARSLSEGAPKMADVAGRLGLSVRSFHRRLADHGVTFQALTEETRRELAEGLLQDDAHSLAEVAFLTGFSEQSAFSRAFKRWVGLTPASYRKDRGRI